MGKILVLGTVILMFSPFAVQADEFGERFYSQAPAGLGDFTASPTQTQDIAKDDTTAQELQEIMPAAGEEEPETPEIAEPVQQ